MIVHACRKINFDFKCKHAWQNQIQIWEHDFGNSQFHFQ
jgi:hypothetical protein